MGGHSVFVIGDNFRDQLDKFQRAEYADRLTNKYFVALDVLAEARERYMQESEPFLQDQDGRWYHSFSPQFWHEIGPDEEEYKAWASLTRENPSFKPKRLVVPPGFKEIPIFTHEFVPFQEWIMKEYGLGILADGEEPDLLGKHRSGWIRLDHAGEVIEAKEHTIPDGIWDWFECTLSYFKLKPGATGLSANFSTEEIVTNCAGSARKGTIDFFAIREAKVPEAADLWDKAAQARGTLTWERFEDLCKKHNVPIHFSYQTEVWTEFRQQAAIEAMFAAGCFRDNFSACLERLGMPREEYLQWHRDREIFDWFQYVVKDGELIDGGEARLSMAEFNALLENLSDDTLLTVAYVHA
ncbi:MAG: hypothetical protein HYZ45_14750 [Burkholderiales bacterium]|nr:hypothetical protein [Burkholderiales bacterium]